jgi:hypothetical protein
MLARDLHEPLLPFPSLPKTVQARHSSNDLALRPFGIYETDLNLDFDHTPRPQLVTRILECCTRHVRNESVETGFFWQLPIGKRIEGLLTLFSSATGTGAEISIAFRCPNRQCAKESQVEITVSEIAEVQEQAYRNETVAVEAATEKLTLRRPTGNDQLSWLAADYGDQQSATKAMLATLLLDGEQRLLKDEWVSLAEQVLDEQDPLVNFSFKAGCSWCEEETLVEIDLEEVSLQALRKAQVRLLSAVHRLATRYHWSEEQIFSVPSWRRSYYLRLIEAERK